MSVGERAKLTISPVSTSIGNKWKDYFIWGIAQSFGFCMGWVIKVENFKAENIQDLKAEKN